MRRLALGAGALIAFVGYIALTPVTTTKPATSTKVCDLTIFAPAHQVTIGAGGSLSVAMSGRALRCPTGTVKISAAVDGGAPSTLATVGVDGGAWSYTATLGDRTFVVLTASMDGGGVMSSDHVTVIADSRNPTLALATPVLTGSGALVVVTGETDNGIAANLHVKASDPGFYPDANPDAGGGQVNLDLTITGANPGTLTVSQDGTQRISYAIASSPAHLTSAQLGVLNLDEGWTGALNFNVTGPNGATALVVPTTVKTTRPAQPVMLLGVSLPDGGYGDPADGGCWTHVRNNRHADIDLCWYMPADAGGAVRTDLAITTTTLTGDAGLTPANIDGPGVRHFDPNDPRGIHW